MSLLKMFNVAEKFMKSSINRFKLTAISVSNEQFWMVFEVLERLGSGYLFDHLYITVY